MVEMPARNATNFPRENCRSKPDNNMDEYPAAIFLFDITSVGSKQKEF